MFVFAFNVGFQELVFLTILGALPLLAIVAALAIIFFVNRDKRGDDSDD